MQRQVFNSGYEIVCDDLSFMQSALAEEIKTRSQILNPGITTAFGNYVTAGSNANTIKVKLLEAIDENGEHISIPADVNNLAPNATDKTTLEVGGTWTNSIRYIVVARYIEVDTTEVIHPTTAISTYSRKEGSYTLHALRRSGGPIDSFVAGDVKLARIDVSAGGLPSITCNGLDADENPTFPVTDYCRMEASKVNFEIGATNSSYGLGMQLTLSDHLNSRGLGPISASNPHGVLLNGALIEDGSIEMRHMAIDAISNYAIQDGAVTINKLDDDAFVATVKMCVQGDAYVDPDGYPFNQVICEKSGTINKAIIYVDDIPNGVAAEALIIDIKKNGTTIFDTTPKIPITRFGTGTETKYDGTVGGLKMIITPANATLPDIGKIKLNTTVVAGDRLNFFITQVGSTLAGGDDMLIYLEIR